MDLVSQFFLEQMLGLGYFATSISLNILAVRPPPKTLVQSFAVLTSNHDQSLCPLPYTQVQKPTKSAW